MNTKKNLIKSVWGIRGWLLGLAALAMVVMTSGIGSVAEEKVAAASDTEESVESVPKYQPKTKVELRRSLSKVQYYVTQEEGTEPAFRNQYWNNKQDGLYQCIVCELPLFSSETKYKSGTGWPSFFAPLKKDAVGYRKDWKLFYARTEVHCSRCRAHLGHVFDDGPRPTGKRFCMNSAAMKFVVEEKDEQPKKSTKNIEPALTEEK